MLKKLFIALVFSSATFVWSGSSFAGGHCVGTTMNDAQTGGKYPQQYELSEYESAASCTMKFSDNPNIASINATIQGNPGSLPPVEDRLPDEPLVCNWLWKNGCLYKSDGKKVFPKLLVSS